VRGEGFKTFDSQNIFNYYPSSTTQKNIVYRIDGEVVTGIDADSYPNVDSVRLMLCHMITKVFLSPLMLRL
jgi:hypothetical protein